MSLSQNGLCVIYGLLANGQSRHKAETASGWVRLVASNSRYQMIPKVRRISAACMWSHDVLIGH
jgi:hypothetical protein